MGAARTFLTTPSQFRDVSRGTPRPHTLKGDDLVRARLTPETWRCEILAEGGTTIATPLTLEKRNALDLPTLEKLGQRHGRKFLKAMQCLNIAQPLGQGLWEGVPLREVLKSVGRINNIRRIYYWGFHNNDPKQIFQSSLTYTQVMDAAPGDLGPLVVYRLNGQPLPQGVMPRDVWGFDPKTGQPKEWPMRYSWALWSVTLPALNAGSYEFRVRSVDQNDFAQPEPRPYQKSGQNPVQVKLITAT